MNFSDRAAKPGFKNSLKNVTGTQVPGTKINEFRSTKPITKEDQLFSWMRKNPNATELPPYLTHVVDQIERYDGTIDESTLSVKDYDIYAIEREIEEDAMAKSDRHMIRQRLAGYLEENIAGNQLREYQYADVVHKLRTARNTGVVGIDPLSGRHITAWDDKVNCVRLCPDEAREETQRLTRKYAPEIFRLLEANPRWRLFYAVYTQANIDEGSLKEGKRNQYKKFSNFHRSTWAKQRIKGSFVIQEDPLAIDSKSWNVHLNVIHVVEGDFSYKELRHQWGNNVEVRQIKGTPEHISQAFLEVVKYAAKHIGEKSEDGKHTKALGMTSWDFDQWHEWFVAGKGFRRSRSYGCLYRFDGIPDKGVALEDVLWVGSINHDGTSYAVKMHRNVESIAVDLIQADNFASPNSDFQNRGHCLGINPPPDRALI